MQFLIIANYNLSSFPISLSVVIFIIFELNSHKCTHTCVNHRGTMNTKTLFQLLFFVFKEHHNQTRWTQENFHKNYTFATKDDLLQNGEEEFT